MIDYRRLFEVGRRVINLARTEQLTLLAAGVAFYGFISLVPLTLLALALAVTIGGEALANYVSTAVSDVLTPSAQELLAETLVDQTGVRSATVVGALGLLWGSSRVLRGLDRAFSKIYGTAASKSLVDTFWDALLVAAAVTGGLTVVAIVEGVIAFVPFVGVAVVGPLLVLSGLFAAFLPMFFIFPGVDIKLREAVPGTVVASIGWFLLSRTFSLYAGFVDDYAVYGVLGVVLLVLIWLYIGSIIIIFGAVLNAVLAGRDTDRQLQSPGVRQVSTEAMTDDATGADGDRSEDRKSARTRDRSDDPEALREEIERLRDRLESFEEDVDQRTVQRDSLEGELKRYVRKRVRRGHLVGWGPYLVLLYGTAMAIAAFYFLEGGWAILAMFVVWTSTLGVYVLMVLFGTGISILGIPGRIRNRIGEWRS
ncbi:YihY/virulence factor BrkB family protein [Halostagnicola sp. A-GB9-2]|uniref:YihY/virulence factor BrkB family protein n=1 Tax=Halostagnicola sp. A-GB9-2 TaxID=3048066 RepID=UPI0024BF486A|nr:YihY/virulence factor BrkB family protein [Halostagnicola sp. A-GB9-2]MDJ1432358.1 YihY/virulence factor BrkB family protein [Halostagnicola sp. A-GB9-2]